MTDGVCGGCDAVLVPPRRPVCTLSNRSATTVAEVDLLLPLGWSSASPPRRKASSVTERGSFSPAGLANEVARGEEDQLYALVFVTDGEAACVREEGGCVSLAVRRMHTLTPRVGH